MARTRSGTLTPMASGFFCANHEYRATREHRPDGAGRSAPLAPFSTTDPLMNKLSLLVGTAAAAAVTLAATTLQDPQTQDSSPRPTQARTQGRDGQRQDGLRQELRDLRAQLQRTEAALKRSEEELLETRVKLDACAGLVVRHSRHEPNCAPSRSLIGSFQWMRQNELEKPARELLTQIVEQQRKDPQRLNRLAWELMTEERTAGRFDLAALEISQQAQTAQKKPSAATLDTHALALFLNGRFSDAAATEQRALSLTRHNKGDFRRRLRMYETAASAATEPSVRAPALVAASERDEE